MSTRQFAKLLTLFVGAGYVTRELNNTLSMARSGINDGFFESGAWLFPTVTVLTFLAIYWYVSRMKFDDTNDSARALVVASVKLFGLYLFVVGLFQFISGVFVLSAFESSPRTPPDVVQTQLLWSPSVLGGLRMILAYVFIFHTAAIVRLLAIRDE